MHKNGDLVSIIIPIYNVKDYLRKCVESILCQTYENIEVVLIDDESTDGSAELCDALAKEDKRVRTIHKKNGGVSSARNTGVWNSKGNLITFVDPDDYVEKNYLETLYKELVENNASMSIVGHITEYVSGKNINRFTNEIYTAKPHKILKKLLYDDGIDTSAWGKMYKRELYKNIEYPEGEIYEDASTTYRLIQKSEKIAVNSVPLYHYIIRKKSISNDTFSESKLDLIAATRRMVKDIKTWYPDLAGGCNRRLMHAYLSTLSQLAKVKKRYPKIEQELITYVKKHGKEVLKDKGTPKRDRIGILSAQCGFGFYRISWNLYLFFSKRRYE